MVAAERIGLTQEKINCSQRLLAATSEIPFI
ncbi:hypothetical protein CBM2605_U10007 [Cupriavidus neocaledonicus]|uniref:Uncharacterized protein n=1 Tax=Cupriavidus neocaledonicus TaxID=1040979 RepID=A0ABY1VE14_9BURK|nr:hypothetical protein CBM2605_U10007 [Cupriavidus neocaledonicus]